MGPLTYKVFNLYCFIRCGTYNSHLHTTLPLKCESINSSCSPSIGSSYLYRRCWFLRKRTDPACTAVAAFCANGPASSIVPSSNRALMPLLGHRGGARGTAHIEATTTALVRETPHSYPKP